MDVDRQFNTFPIVDDPVRHSCTPGEWGYQVDLAGSPAACRRIQTLDLFNIYEAIAHSRNNQSGLVKSILVNEIPLSLVFMILISSMKIEELNIYI